jgi:pimeloyl-ACP methyl ester carboxylesterase
MTYADVNGLSLYYEEHGAGDPVILLHGGLGGSDVFNPTLPELAGRRRFIAVDLQGHGRTADVERPLRMETCADDIAALIRHLGLERVDVVGYSFGGGVGLRLAIQHPELVRRLVVACFPVRRDGWLPDVLAQMEQMSAEDAHMMKGSPPYEFYARVAPKPENFPELVGKLGEMLKLDYDYSADVGGITARVLLAFADSDSVPLSHVAEFYGLFGGGLRDAGWDGSARPETQVAVIPGATHYDMFANPAFAAAITTFLS